MTLKRTRSFAFVVLPSRLSAPIGEVEQMARRDARRIRHVVGGALRGNPQPSRAVVRGRALLVGQRLIPRGHSAAAEEADRRLLVGGEPQRVLETSDGARDQPGIVPPDQARPRAGALVEHVLRVRRRVELLVVVDSEVSGRFFDENAAHARRREDRVRVGHHHERAEAAVLDEVEAAGETVEARVVPRDRERDRRIEKDAEVIARCRCVC